MGITGVNEHIEPVFNAVLPSGSYRTLWVSFAEVSMFLLSWPIMQLTVLLILFISFQLQASTVTSVDKTRLKIGQSLQLKVSSDDSAGKSPNLAVLKKSFKIIGSSKVSRPYLKNNQRKHKTLWFYILQPKRAGQLIIPAISVNSKKSKAIAIRVSRSKKPTSTAGASIKKEIVSHDIIVKAMLNKSKLYPNQMLIYTLSINFPDHSNSDFKIQQPFIAGAVILPLATPSFQQIKVRSKARTIRSQSYAIFTEKVGYYQIEPASVSFNQAKLKKAKPIVLKANQLHFEIVQKANQTSLGYWLPSEGLTLSQVWQDSTPQDITVGSTIYRTLSLKAEGLNADILPLISTLTHENISIKLQNVSVENSIEEGKLVAIRTEQVAMTFNRVGSISIDPIDIHWWNTKFNQARVTTLTAQRFNVVPVTKTIYSPTQQPQTTADKTNQQPLTRAEPAAQSPSDPSSTSKNPALVSVLSNSADTTSPTKLFSKQQLTWLILILFVLLVASTLGWLLSHHKAKR
ncbi:MAG: hypothetical protein OFPII_12610 [Osedax symbiont Rs1]|nr:MAG: hypothetical protein OFPII_12610 [Osedax symbiont Rs1]